MSVCRPPVRCNFFLFLDDGTTSLAKGRSRRQKVDKKGRLSAFEKLREAKEKGLKNKYEVTYHDMAMIRIYL